MFDLRTPHNVAQFAGMRIVQAAMHPKYVLPAEIIPGVPWPPGFREEINAWSSSFLGTTCLVPRGTAYVMNDNTVMMHPQDFVAIRNIR